MGCRGRVSRRVEGFLEGVLEGNPKKGLSRGHLEGRNMLFREYDSLHFLEDRNLLKLRSLDLGGFKDFAL